MEPSEFLLLVEHVVEEVLRELAAKLKVRLDNVEISVEDWPSPETLRAVDAPDGQTIFGLYQGIPRPERSVFQVGAFPDRIVLFLRTDRIGGNRPLAGQKTRPRDRYPRNRPPLRH